MVGVRSSRAVRPKRGALTVVAAMLCLSAMIRMGSDAGQVMALQNSGPAPDVARAQEAQPLSCGPEPDYPNLLSALQDREARLTDRELSLKLKEQDLAVATKVVEARLSELVQAEQRLSDTMAMAKSAAENDVGQLTKMYEAMKPKQAAALFEQMDPEFAAGFLARMKPEAAANILAGLTPTTAYSLSVVLAGRNADVPTQ